MILTVALIVLLSIIVVLLIGEALVIADLERRIYKIERNEPIVIDMQGKGTEAANDNDSRPH